MKEVVKNEAGEVVAFRTNRLGVMIRRQAYTDGGKTHWVKHFHMAKMINGELARFPLSSVPADAQRIGDQIAAFLMDPTHTLLDAKQKFNPRSLARVSNFSTVGDLLDFHADHWNVLELGEATGESYARGLLVILRQVEAYQKGTLFESWAGMRPGAERDARRLPWLEKSLAVVTERLAADYQRLMVPPDLEDEEEELSQKITCDSNLRSARGLFSREAMKLYRRSHLSLPDLTGFLSVSLFNAKKFFVLPPITVVKNLFVAAPTLKAADLNAYRGFLVCVQAGLRKSEAANFQLDWLQEQDTPVVLIHEDGVFKPKHGHGRTVLLDAWVAEEIRSLAPAGGKYFIQGNNTERTENVFDRLNAWLRTCGVDANKPTHELRKLWFSQKVKRENLLAAAQQGGHRDPKITSFFYASNQMPDNVLPFWQEPTLAALAKVIKTA